MMKRRAATNTMVIPTNDMAVRARLRDNGEPITLFGEKEMERRDRLRIIMAKLDDEGKLKKTRENEEAKEELHYPFYTEGSNSLVQCRIDIAKYSLVRAALRLQRAERIGDAAEIERALNQAGNLGLQFSQFGDDRPLTGCSFSRANKWLATCSLTGTIKLWSTPRLTEYSTFRGHKEHATDVSYSPVHCHHLATASADRTAKYWNDQGSLLQTFEGHLDRLKCIAFHPSGNYLGTASFDKTWRLWDIETGEELLLQQGHSRSVYGLAFHLDGSLAASCGRDALARVWDLRVGRSILALEGHVKPIHGISFSPDGYHLATGGEDNTCRVWDLRKFKSIYTIPAHTKYISHVKFDPSSGHFLVTASADMTAKVWSARDFKPVKTLLGHEAKITSLDVAGDDGFIATVSQDCTVKLWSTDLTSEEKEAMDFD